MGKLLAKLGFIAGLLVVGASGYAFWDTDILIQRALNSPDFTVKYTGAAASLIELRVNGASIGTQQVSSAKSAGEATFTLDLLSLNDGDNTVEVRLFDKNGKLLGTQRMMVYADEGTQAPVKLNGLKMGATVQGSLEVSVGFGREMRNSYVSFFVDEQFKSMTNSAPFSYFWDTTTELNGWHELQAWVVDEQSLTFKTRKYRVFVNNPGGRTDRRLPQQATEAVAKVASNVKTSTTQIQAAKATAASTRQAANVAKAVTNVAKTTTTAKTAVKNVANVAKAQVNPMELSVAVQSANAIMSQSVGFKSARTQTAETAGARIVAPKTLQTKLNIAGPAITAVNSARTVMIKRGTRLPDAPIGMITLDGKPVSFDVQPRVQNGVPLAPIRHLMEAKGGKVDWENLTKTMFGEVNGKKIVVKIGDRTATIDKLQVELESLPFLEKGRTIVPLSFIQDSMQVDVEYDRKTGHVLITSIKKRTP